MPSRIIGKIEMDDFNFEGDIEYLNALSKQPEEYDEFGQGDWRNVSIYNGSGQGSDSRFRVVERCFPTPHAQACPNIRAFLKHCFKFENLKMVRARNLVDGIVIPHRDFVEMEGDVTCFRVFVALEYNSEAFHSDAHGVFQMRPGEVWFLDASIDHAAINFGVSSRIFLCLDFMFEGHFEDRDIFAQGASIHGGHGQSFITHEPFSKAEEQSLIVAVAHMLNRFTFKEIVFALSKYHFTYEVPVSACYDWLVQAAERAGKEDILIKAKSLRRYLLESRVMGERYTINQWAS